MSDGIRPALQRIKHSMADLRRLNLGRGDLDLDRVSQAVVHADELLSALSLIHDALFEESVALGLIGRRPRYAITAGKDPLDVNDEQALKTLGEQKARRASQFCGADVPGSTEPCRLPPGHKGGHKFLNGD